MPGEDMEQWQIALKQKASQLAALVRARLEELGTTPTQAARSVGLPSGFITDILSGRKSGVQGRNFEKLARALKWTPEDLAGFGSSRRPGRLDIEVDEAIPLLGDVAPGVWVDTRTSSEVEDYVPYDIIFGKTLPENNFDVTVKGTSVNRIAIDGQRIRCLRHEDFDFIPPSSICVLERLNGTLRERSAMKFIGERDRRLSFEFPSFDQKWKSGLITGMAGESEEGIFKLIGIGSFAYLHL